MAIVEEFSSRFKDELIFIDELSPNDLREEEVIAIQDVEPSEDVLEGDASKEDLIPKESRILSTDRNEKSPLKTHECGNCSKMFSTRAKMLKHYKIHQENVQIGFDGKRSWMCSKCKREFVSRKGWIIHQRSHTGERPYTCLTCRKSFIDSSTLMKHQVIHQAVRPFTCDACGHGFNQKVALQRHEKTHIQQQEFGCGFCPKTFLVKCSLEAHEKLHSGVKPFQCKYCSGTFHTLTALRQHKRVHMNEQPPTCLLCKKIFTDSKTLLEHMEMHIHSTSSNLPCPVCPLSFNLRITLRKHIRAHVARGNVRFCNLCQLVFQSEQDTIVHFDKHIKVSSKNAECKVVDDVGSAVKEPDKNMGSLVKDLEKNGYKSESNNPTNHPTDSMTKVLSASVMKDLEKNGYKSESNNPTNYPTDSMMKVLSASVMKNLEKNCCNMENKGEDNENYSTDFTVMKVSSPKKVVESVDGNNSTDSLIRDTHNMKEEENYIFKHSNNFVKEEENDCLIRTKNIVKDEKSGNSNDHIYSGGDMIKVHQNGSHSIFNEDIQEIEQDGKTWKENGNQPIINECVEGVQDSKQDDTNGHVLEDNTTYKQNMGFSSLEALCNVAVSAAKELPDFHQSATKSESTTVVTVKGEKSPKKNSTHSLNGIGFFCKACNRMYSSAVDFRKHRCTLSTGVMGRRKCKVRVAHAQSKRVFSCDECNKSFRSKNGFLIHQRSHTGERPYPCRWCDKAFGDSGTRHKHERIHTGERPFQCNHCPRAFNQRAALRAHQVTHSVCYTRSHTCKLCPSSFSYFANLQRHVVSCHRECNALPCPLCTLHKTLHYDTSSLHEHVRSAHWATRDELTCPICDLKEFKNVSAYCSHIVCHAKRKPHLVEVRLNNNSIKQEDCDNIH